MKRKWILTVLMIICGVALVACDDKKDELPEKIDSLIELKSSLETKEQKAGQLYSDYIAEIKDLRDEIRGILNAQGIANYEQAVQVARVANNLKLISKKLAYVEKLHQLNQTLLHAYEEVDYLERDAQTDYKMVTTLKSEEINELLKKINFALDKYSPVANQSILNGVEADGKISVMVWNDIITKPLKDGRLGYLEKYSRYATNGDNSDRSLLRQIERGRIDLDWYMAAENNIIPVEANSFCARDCDYQRSKVGLPYLAYVEKVITVKPYTVFCVIFQSTQYQFDKLFYFDNNIRLIFSKENRHMLYDLDFDCVKVLNTEKTKDAYKVTIYPDKPTRVFFVFKYINLSYLSSGVELLLSDKRTCISEGSYFSIKKE